MKPPSYYIKKYVEFVVEHGEFSYVPIVDVLVGKCFFNTETLSDAWFNFFFDFYGFMEITEETEEARETIRGYGKLGREFNNLDLIERYIQNRTWLS